MAESVAAWLVLMIAGLSGMLWLLWQCAEEHFRRQEESEYHWQSIEEERRRHETHRFLQSARDLDRRVYPRYDGGVSEIL